MSPYAQRQRRQLATWAFGLFCTLTFAAWSRQPSAAPVPASDSMVFSMSLQDSNGDVLASPSVSVEPGQKVQVRMACEEDPQSDKMRLTLSPMGVENGQMLYSYELSVGGQVTSQKGTVKLAMGRERRIHLRDSRGVTLSVYAEPLKQYLQRRKAKVARVAS
jgi:hypothetical protein